MFSHYFVFLYDHTIDNISYRRYTESMKVIRRPTAFAAVSELRTGMDVILAQLKDSDPNIEVRQLGIVDAKGNAVSFTGKKCNAWAGGKTGKHYACQGNILAGEKVVDDMAKAFEDATGPLAWRLMAALEAGDKAGGDKRGKQSAALLIHTSEEYPALSLRVDDHADPLAELKRLEAVARERFVAFATCLPTRADPGGLSDRAAIEARIAAAMAEEM